jgi:hypothetical protein
MSLAPDPNDLRDPVRKILLRVWDPIGIREFLVDNYDAVRDEYDAYLTPVINMITEGAREPEIENYLFEVETQLMHRRRSRDCAAYAASSLCALRDQQA